MKVGITDKADYLKYKEWMKKRYPQLNPGILFPDFVKQYNAEMHSKDERNKQT